MGNCWSKQDDPKPKEEEVSPLLAEPKPKKMAKEEPQSYQNERQPVPLEEHDQPKKEPAKSSLRQSHDRSSTRVTPVATTQSGEVEVMKKPARAQQSAAPVSNTDVIVNPSKSSPENLILLEDDKPPVVVQQQRTPAPVMHAQAVEPVVPSPTTEKKANVLQELEQQQKLQLEQERRQREEEAARRQLEEQEQARKEAENQERLRQEAKKHQEEQQRLKAAEEQKQHEEQQRLIAEENRKKAEEAVKKEQERIALEEQAKKEERIRQEEEAKAAEELRLAQEAAQKEEQRLAEEERVKQELAKKEEEERLAREEEERIQQQNLLQEEEAKKAEQERVRQEEEAKAAEELSLSQEAAQQEDRSTEELTGQEDFKDEEIEEVTPEDWENLDEVKKQRLIHLTLQRAQNKNRIHKPTTVLPELPNLVSEEEFAKRAASQSEEAKPRKLPPGAVMMPGFNPAAVKLKPTGANSKNGPNNNVKSTNEVEQPAEEEAPKAPRKLPPGAVGMMPAFDPSKVQLKPRGAPKP